MKIKIYKKIKETFNNKNMFKVVFALTIFFVMFFIFRPILKKTDFVFAATCPASMVGDGTQGNPCQITSWAQLDAIRQDGSLYYKLMQDLSAESAGYIDYNNPEGTGWTPIGIGWVPPLYEEFDSFTGEFDGDGKKISDLFINISEGEIEGTGLFGTVGTGAVIKNVVIEDAVVSGGLYYTGGLAGINNGEIINCSVEGTVTNEDGENNSTGGLVGENSDDGSISNSYATATVTGLYDVGGLVGINRGEISNSYATGEVTGTSFVGGLVGTNQSSINSSYATGEVTGTSFVGGLVGTNYGGIINSYVEGEKTVQGTQGVGGLVGDNSDSIINSYATVNVIGMTDVGGLVGSNSGEISISYSEGLITAGGDDREGSAGGLVGYNTGDITDCYARGSVAVTGAEEESCYAGGLIASNSGSVINSYAMGEVTCQGGGSNVYVGGLVGNNNAGILIANSFWDVETSGVDTDGDGATSYGKTTEQMKTLETFLEAGWNIALTEDHEEENWYIDQGTDYPKLGQITYIIKELPEEVQAVLESEDVEETIDVSENGQIGEKEILIKNNSVNLAKVKVQFSANRNWINFSGDIDNDNKKSFVNFSNINGIVGTHTLYIPGSSGSKKVRICPNASSLNEVTEDCAGGFELANCENNGTISANYLDGFWIVSGLSGTGGMEISVPQPVSQNVSQPSLGGGVPTEALLPPTAPTEGFKILINNNDSKTYSRNVILTLLAGLDTEKMALDNDSSLSGISSTGQIPYKTTYNWDICANKEDCPEGQYSVYVKFFTKWGQGSELVVDSIFYQPTAGDEKLKNINFCKITGYPKSYIKFGDNNNYEDVKLLQNFFNIQEGYNFVLDGVYSSKVRDAVIKWQEKYASEILASWGFKNGTGYVYENSLKKIKEIYETECAENKMEQKNSLSLINKYKFNRNLSVGAKGEDVKELQKLLNNNGFFLDIQGPGSLGKETYFFGQLTQSALSRFQKINNIYPSNGYFGPITRNLINNINK